MDTVRFVGIDLGKSALHICAPIATSWPPREWPVVEISYADRSWWRYLLDLIPDGAHVCAESTGAHTLTPVARLIAEMRPAAVIWQIDSRTSQAIRVSHLSNAKTDAIDARAIAITAMLAFGGEPPRGCRLYDPPTVSAVERLRMVVLQHVRATKDRTRALNRLAALSFAVWPGFAKKTAYINAARAGLFTPAAIRAAVDDLGPLPGGLTEHHRHHLRRLVLDVPPVDAAAPTLDSIRECIESHDAADALCQRHTERLAYLLSLPPFDAPARRWSTIPGYSDIFAAAILVGCHGAVLSMSKDEFVASVGTAPLSATSGDGDATRNSRRGFAPARQCMYLWTMILCRSAGHPVQLAYAKHQSIYPARTKLARMLWGIANDPGADPVVPDEDSIPF